MVGTLVFCLMFVISQFDHNDGGKSTAAGSTVTSNNVQGKAFSNAEPSTIEKVVGFLKSVPPYCTAGLDKIQNMWIFFLPGLIYAFAWCVDWIGNKMYGAGH
jgi:hypothetical protein